MMDYIKTAGAFLGMTGSPEKGADGKKKESGSGSMILDFIKKMGGKESKEADDVKETAEKERAGIFSEVASSVLTRTFPSVSKITTLISAGLQATGVRERAPEAHALQNEIDNILAFTMFVPDSILKIFTDKLVNSEMFMKLLSYWPKLGESRLKELEDKEKYDPDTVIDILRIISQDISTGKVSYDKIMAGIGLEGGVMDVVKKAVA